MNKVLVVDNDVLILRFVSDVLLKEGCQVVTAKDGLSALDIFQWKPQPSRGSSEKA
jgi:CheY-like chemotaxis protein